MVGGGRLGVMVRERVPITSLELVREGESPAGWSWVSWESWGSWVSWSESWVEVCDGIAELPGRSGGVLKSRGNTTSRTS